MPSSAGYSRSRNRDDLSKARLSPFRAGFQLFLSPDRFAYKGIETRTHDPFRKENRYPSDSAGTKRQTELENL